jgi:hypothetical protein
MNDYAFKFLDEAEANSILYRKEGVIKESEGIEANAGYDVANYQNIDVLGTIEGIDGYHVNIRDDGDCSALEQYVVYPKHPVRTFA